MAPDRISIKFDGADRDIVMSLGLLRALARTVGDPGQAVLVMLQDELRDAVLKEVVAERNEYGKIVQEHDLDGLPMSAEDAIAVVDWASEHVLSFFVGRLKKVEEMSKGPLQKIKDLDASASGSVA